MAFSASSPVAIRVPSIPRPTSTMSHRRFGNEGTFYTGSKAKTGRPILYTDSKAKKVSSTQTLKQSKIPHLRVKHQNTAVYISLSTSILCDFCLPSSLFKISVYLSIYLSIHPSMSVRLSVYLSSFCYSSENVM